MNKSHTLSTERLLLRQWRDADLPYFADLNTDPRVNKFFFTNFTRELSDEAGRRIRARIDERGWGLWAVEIPDECPFIGFVGLSIPRWEARFTPCVEIGWRLAHAHWGKGYATEAARAALHFGFQELKLPEIVSFTVPANMRSRAVMERLGMTHDPADDFDHPEVPAGHPLQRHVLYRLRSPLNSASP